MLARIFACVGIVLFTTACGSADDRAPRLDEGDWATASQASRHAASSADSSAENEEPCVEGETDACVYVLPEHEGVTSCVVGVRQCLGGEWTGCMRDGSGDSEAP